MSGLQSLWQRWAGVPFGYGTFDCAILAAWWYDQRTGSNHSEWIQSLDYHSGREAMRLVRSSGGLRAAVTQRIGPPVPVVALDAGDLCLLRLGRRGVIEVLGILAPQQVLIASPKGLLALPRNDDIAEGWPCRKR